MSRSNPTDNSPNPSTRWFEWNGEAGTIRYYDKDKKKNIDVALPFTFLLLDELGSVRGWHESSQSGIYANEVRDTRQDVLVVKAFKGGTLATGLYKDIKDRVNTAGGGFVSNCYIAFKSNGHGLVLGSVRFKGAALGAWMEFRKANRAELWEKAVEITGYTEGKKGRVIFRVPTFGLKAASADTQRIAVDLDKALQAFLDGYLKRTKHDQVAAVGATPSQAPPHDDEPPFEDHEPISAPDDDDIPF